MNNKSIYFLIIVAIIIGGYYLFFTNKQIDKKEEIKQEEISKTDLVAKELADKYQAITDWEENINYTLQAQEMLVAGKPILFRGYVDDIFNRGEKTFIRFSSSYFGAAEFVMELECNRKVVDKILSEQREDDLYFFDDFIVVADIQEISKPVFALEGSSLSEEEVEIDIESSNFFTAKGTCLDVAYIGDN